MIQVTSCSYNYMRFTCLINESDFLSIRFFRGPSFLVKTSKTGMKYAWRYLLLATTSSTKKISLKMPERDQGLGRATKKKLNETSKRNLIQDVYCAWDGIFSCITGNFTSVSLLSSSCPYISTIKQPKNTVIIRFLAY